MAFLDDRFLRDAKVKMDRAFTILEIAATSPGGLESIPIQRSRDELLNGIVDVAREFLRNRILPGQEARQKQAVQRLQSAIQEMDNVVTVDYSLSESDEAGKDWFDYSPADMGRDKAAKILVGLWGDLWDRDQSLIEQIQDQPLPEDSIPPEVIRLGLAELPLLFIEKLASSMIEFNSQLGIDLFNANLSVLKRWHKPSRRQG